MSCSRPKRRKPTTTRSFCLAWSPTRKLASRLPRRHAAREISPRCDHSAVVTIRLGLSIFLNDGRCRRQLSIQRPPRRRILRVVAPQLCCHRLFHEHQFARHHRPRRHEAGFDEIVTRRSAAYFETRQRGTFHQQATPVHRTACGATLFPTPQSGELQFLPQRAG